MLSVQLISILALLFCGVVYVMAVTQAVRRAMHIAEWRGESEEDPRLGVQSTDAAQ